MSKISKTEIYSMTKEQNYRRGYIDGKMDVLDKIRADIRALSPKPTAEDVFEEGNPIKEAIWETLVDVLQIIDNYGTESE